MPVNIEAPSLQSRLRFAEYSVDMETDKSGPDIESGLAALLAREPCPGTMPAIPVKGSTTCGL